MQNTARFYIRTLSLDGFCNNNYRRKKWKRDLTKPIASVVSCKFRIFLLEIHSNCVAPVFQGGDLCVIMEN